MIVLNMGGLTSRIVVTLFEKQSIGAPYFVFVFTNITTREDVIYAPSLIADISPSKGRYNEFLIPMSLFTGRASGQWLYKVYESPIATVEVAGLKVLENGKMVLISASTVSLTGYESAITMTGYNGG